MRFISRPGDTKRDRLQGLRRAEVSRAARLLLPDWAAATPRLLSRAPACGILAAFEVNEEEICPAGGYPCRVAPRVSGNKREGNFFLQLQRSRTAGGPFLSAGVLGNGADTAVTHTHTQASVNYGPGAKFQCGPPNFWWILSKSYKSCITSISSVSQQRNTERLQRHPFCFGSFLIDMKALFTHLLGYIVLCRSGTRVLILAVTLDGRHQSPTDAVRPRSCSDKDFPVSFRLAHEHKTKLQSRAGMT